MTIKELMARRKETPKKNYKQSFAVGASREYKIFVAHKPSCSRSSIRLYGNENGDGDVLEAELGFATQLRTASRAQAIRVQQPVDSAWQAGPRCRTRQ